MTTSTGTTAAPAVGVTTSQGLSDWAAPYITNYLGQAQALSQQPYEAFQGPLTAGTSPLQSQAFQGIAGLAIPDSMTQAQQTAGDVATKAGNMTYSPVSGTFDAQQAQQYMNPYLQAALQPQLEELRRQSQINFQPTMTKLTQAGGYGGSRQAILEAEANRNLLQEQNKTVGQGYASAYDKAMAQFNAEQDRKAREAQFGASYGLDALGRQLSAAQAQGALGADQLGQQRANLEMLARAGAEQRGIEQQGLTADYEEFTKQKQFPYQQVQFLRDMITGLPAASVSSTQNAPTGIAALISAAGGIDQLLKSAGQSAGLTGLLKNLGLDLTGGNSTQTASTGASA